LGFAILARPSPFLSGCISREQEAQVKNIYASLSLVVTSSRKVRLFDSDFHANKENENEGVRTMIYLLITAKNYKMQ